MSLGGKNTVQVNAGDRLTILTPGGGGHGSQPVPPDEGDGSKSIDGDKHESGGSGRLGPGAWDEEDPDRKSRRQAEMRLSGSVSGHRLGQEQA